MTTQEEMQHKTTTKIPFGDEELSIFSETKRLG